MAYFKQMVSETDLDSMILECSKNFMLTGSRFMNSKFGDIIPIQDTTDYDFVTFDGDPKLTTWTYAIDLDNRSASKPSLYKDKNTVDVFDYKCGNKSINVIVKTVESFKTYCVLFDTMDAEFYKKYIWKTSDVWESNVSTESRKDIIRERINILIDYLKVQLT